MKENKRRICQNCKSHKNHPSFCNKEDKHTPRKGYCDSFERKK